VSIITKKGKRKRLPFDLKPAPSNSADLFTL
jgi:hypothetical protein